MNTTYIICTVHRSGSTLLGDMIHRTRIAGYPAEYFDPVSQASDYWHKIIGCGSEDDFLDKAIASGSTENGVFGVKLHWNHVPTLRRRLRDSLARNGATLAEDLPLNHLIEAKIGPVKYIWLRRKNKIAQGISHYKATRTGIWSAEAKSEDRATIDQQLTFDFPQIHQHVQLVSEQDQQWALFFKAHQIAPLMLVYEDFLEDPALTLKSLFRFLSLPSENLDCSLPNRKKQSDGRSKEWERTYRTMHIQRLRSTLAELEKDNDGDCELNGGHHPMRQDGLAIPSSQTAHDDAEVDAQAPKITAYAMHPDNKMAIVPASPKREWMDQTANRFAYRCLPLTLANQAGWVLLNQRRIEITWDGRNSLDAIRVVADDGSAPHFVQSHFGHGIITFLIPYIFRTSEGYNLLIRGPANSPKDGICALEGLVETDWLEASSTMNWRLTRPNLPVVFEKDEPIAMIVPMKRGELELFTPQFQAISDNPDLHQGYARWAQSRGQFNRELHRPDSLARQQGWQRHYMQGKSVDERDAKEHQIKLRLSKFLTAISELSVENKECGDE